MVNANHPKVVQLLGKEDAIRQEQIKNLTDLALLSNGLLKGEALHQFIERSVEQIG